MVQSPEDPDVGESTQLSWKETSQPLLVRTPSWDSPQARPILPQSSHAQPETPGLVPPLGFCEDFRSGCSRRQKHVRMVTVTLTRLCGQQRDMKLCVCMCVCCTVREVHVHTQSASMTSVSARACATPTVQGVDKHVSDHVYDESVCVRTPACTVRMGVKSTLTFQSPCLGVCVCVCVCPCGLFSAESDNEDLHLPQSPEPAAPSS